MAKTKSKITIKNFLAAVHSEAAGLKRKINIMEVCGTHTMAISRYGIRQLLPYKINLISGPGCPVCVTPIEEVDKAIELAGIKNVITATFGDMMRVPGTKTTLAREKSKGRDIRIVYSAFDALALAEKNKEKNVVFLGIGFETTSPTVALTVKEAARRKLKNFFILPEFKTVIPPMEALLLDKNIKLDGFIAPGHVSAIIGAKPYEYLTNKYKIPCVITGFEAEDIMQSILMLIMQVKNKEGKVEIQYKRIVRYEGNKEALNIMDEIYLINDSNWRGIGIIPLSGMILNNSYNGFNAVHKFHLVKAAYSKEPAGCRCGDVLKGIVIPKGCQLFSRKCTPENPVGACMVSSEGTCAAYYKYET